jgi:hypothetical protein
VAHQVGLVLDPRGVVHDLGCLLAPLVVPAQLRSVLVGDLGSGRHPLADELAEGGHVLLGHRPLAGVGQQAIEGQAQVGVELVPVEADGLLVRGVVREHDPQARER